ncbi:hypothetical protein SAMN03159443_03812 [Pseudomonas sp. NFACC15-1]|nr:MULTISPECIES: hypothetical protein [unclassified Pseudomonas]SDA86145.1 hypothetical protein SAMN03159443_03812 [Pseudomonas sp. NFACC15-1]SDB27741.1 hypothetical protein SAMN03159290_01991 [Pseudomonas sp. NFACC13-1]SDW93821.1 hypothetical protein SAMN03159380_01343 [Pseudomonas sp. NFACC14]
MNLTAAPCALSINRVIDRQAHDPEGWGQGLDRLETLVAQGMPD